MEMSEQMYIETLKTIQAMGGAKSDLPNFLNEGLKVVMEFIQGENNKQQKCYQSNTPRIEQADKIDNVSFEDKLKEMNKIFSTLETYVDDKERKTKELRNPC